MRGLLFGAPLESKMSAGHALSRAPALDGVRAIAVLAVLVGHYGRVPWLARGGVTIFFVLSGYLITRLLLAEYRRTDGIDIRRFYLRRACRIFPAYYVFLALSWAVLSRTATPMSPGGVLATTTYTANYYVMSHPQGLVGLVHTWSLSVEEQFYLLWPAALLLLLRGGIWRVRCGLALAIIGGLATQSSWVGFGFAGNAPWLAIGCLLATVPPVSLARWTWTPRWLGNPGLAWIGTVSYPMYLWHVWGAVLGVQLTDARAWRFVLDIMITVLLASISYYLVERPVLRWRDQRFPARPGSAIAGVPLTIPIGGAIEETKR
jgi:peptidoglycan/LPS O-acetylase OafA/YrhL